MNIWGDTFQHTDTNPNVLGKIITSSCFINTTRNKAIVDAIEESHEFAKIEKDTTE